MRKKKLKIVGYAFIILLICTISASADWRTFSSKDEMTGETTWYAHSSQVRSTEEMGFPYHDTKAWLGVGNEGEDEWVYIGFSNEPNISDDETQDGYNVIRTRVKWDDSIENMRFTQSWGSKFLHFRNDSIAISKIVESNTILVELNWYGEGKVYFRFPLDGSAAAIEKIRNAK